MDQLNDESGISSLPPEVMETIFEYLTLRERLTASLTCKRWYQLAFSPKFSRNMCISFNPYDEVKFEHIRAYQNYRNVSVTSYVPDRNKSAQADFLRTAPVESMKMHGTIETVATLLNEHLPFMNQLTELEVCIYEITGRSSRSVLTICHPSLKQIQLYRYPEIATYEIDCPNLTHLGLSQIPESNYEKVAQLVIKLQLQLQYLEIGMHEKKLLKMLAYSKLSNLKCLRLHINNYSADVLLFSNTMVNLVELYIFTKPCQETVGEELGVLKNLSKLTLSWIRIEAEGFAKALLKMTKLKDLNFHRCCFKSPVHSRHIASETVRNLSVVCQAEDRPVMLPFCTNLKSLQLTVYGKPIDDIFERACNSYPHLESLHFEAEYCARFHSSTSFSHIKQLRLLKTLQLTDLSLESLNWTECSGMEIEKLRLNCCETSVEGILQMMESFGPTLRQLFLNSCNRPGEMITITKKFVQLLRKDFPRCRISFKF